MKKTEPLQLKIKNGQPIVNCGHIVFKAKKFAAVEIDMRSKWCEVDCTIGQCDGEVGISIGTTDRSMFLNKKHPEGLSTEVYFPQFKGWNIFVAECSRYTVRVCFEK